jgi:hypothetical protein
MYKEKTEEEAHLRRLICINGTNHLINAIQLAYSNRLALAEYMYKYTRNTNSDASSDIMPRDVSDVNGVPRASRN